MSNFSNIVILTGAGISAESGIKTFRDNNGLWENHRLEDVATPEAFARDPELVQRFYNLRRQQLFEVEPNAAHKALTMLQKDFKGSVTLVTQNVDDLHERAGHIDVLHMHGQLRQSRCIHCGQVSPCVEDLSASISCAACTVKGGLRPNIVWFGEMPFYMDAIEQALANADLFISIGTSGNVYPAAGFVAQASHYGAHTVELNLEPSQGGSLFDEAHYGVASKIVPEFVSGLLS